MKNLKNNSSTDSILVHIDFSENYVCKYNQEVQSVHFGSGRQQVTIHTGVYYNKENDDVISYPFATISPSLRHDSASIWAHLKPIFEWILQKFTKKPKYVHMLSDGPSSQYRNKKMFYLISNHVQQLVPGVENFTWNYSETGHGKGAPDGIGAVLKRTADRIVAEGKDVHNYNTFISVLRESCKGVTLFEVTNDDVNKSDELISEDIKTFFGTMKVHQVAYSSKSNMLNFRSLSFFTCDASILCKHYNLGTAFEYNSKSTVSSVDDCNKGKNSEVLNIGDWVLVEYEKNLYPGELKAMCLKYVTVDLMVPARGGKYKWPFPKDIHNYPRTDIKRKISQPIPYGNRARQFYFPNL
ncbi:uncharacterized protein LOC129956613 [Argiope bruennichi]|uniref:uncharacterized protein LOC129956613 n=1 Tax=Argiope bruennichi TaxID=94029 RepID=UPI00249423F1|nr:uncharacterized protein LOC129956613 [Argiope bruennichi]